MSQKYKIAWIEKKVGQSGKEYYVMSLETEAGVKTDKVSTFESTYQAGMDIEGTIVQNGNFLDWKPFLETPDFIKNQRGGNYKTQQIEKVMDKKNESISHFQDKKEESIALAGAQRDAVLIVTNYPTRDSEEEIKKSIIKWRNWFLSSEFKDYPPF